MPWAAIMRCSDAECVMGARPSICQLGILIAHHLGTPAVDWVEDAPIGKPLCSELSVVVLRACKCSQPPWPCRRP